VPCLLRGFLKVDVGWHVRCPILRWRYIPLVGADPTDELSNSAQISLLVKKLKVESFVDLSCSTLDQLPLLTDYSWK
jgi:hypothetical protein